MDPRRRRSSPRSSWDQHEMNHKTTTEFKAQRAAYMRQWRIDNPDKAKAIDRRKYAKEMANPETKALRLAVKRAYRRKNKHRVQKWHKGYMSRHAQQRRDYGNSYYAANRDKCMQRSIACRVARVARDPSLKIIDDMRGRLLQILSGYRKHKPFISILGCSREELKSHLEKQFLPGMTWHNRGHKGWHIDHIIPCCQFNHSIQEQVEKCWHYTNLRPLWAKDNLSRNRRNWSAEEAA